MSSAKQELLDRIYEDEQQRIRCAVSWKYGITNEDEITRRVKRLRATDAQNLLWEYEDHEAFNTACDRDD
jgi:hypothetical protein